MICFQIEWNFFDFILEQNSSADRVKKIEECIALIEELKTYRERLINQKDALKMIRENEKIEETILELAIA